MRVAVYLRVSKKDGSQDTENQLQALAALCARQSWEIIETYRDEESGRKGRSERRGFDAMFKAAHQHRFDMVLFWSLDRFSREGIAQTLNYLRQLEDYGVRFYSHEEEYINTRDDLVRPILLAILSHMAAYEAKRISDRTRAGLERARKAGRRLGAPRKIDRHIDELERLFILNVRPADIVRAMHGKLSRTTVMGFLKKRRGDGAATTKVQLGMFDPHSQTRIHDAAQCQ